MIDGNARVISEAGAPIPGLFAAGGAVGGFHGGRHVGFAGGLVMAAVTGLVAGEAASAVAEVGVSMKGASR